MLEGFCSDKSSLLTCAQSRARWRQREQNGEGSGGTCHTVCTCSIWNQSFNLISGVATGLSIHPSKKEKIRWMFTRQLDVNQLLFQKWVRARGISANSWLQSVFSSSEEIWGRKSLSVYCFKCCIYFIHQIFSPSTAPVKEGRDLIFSFCSCGRKTWHDYAGSLYQAGHLVSRDVGCVPAHTASPLLG